MASNLLNTTYYSTIDPTFEIYFSGSMAVYCILPTMFCMCVLGGPGQFPHLAPTYAAVCAIAIAGVYYPQAYDVIDRYI
jgi:prenyltransferase beta subunit